MNPELEMNLLRRQNLGDSLRRAAKAAGDKPAVIFYTADGAAETHSYAQLNAWDPLESTCRHASLSIL